MNNNKHLCLKRKDSKSWIISNSDGNVICSCKNNQLESVLDDIADEMEELGYEGFTDEIFIEK